MRYSIGKNRKSNQLNFLKMKKIFFYTIALCLSFRAQAQLYNSGAILKLTNGATVQVNGNFTNTASATFINDGTLNVKGSVTNHQAMGFSNSGTLAMVGTSTQNIQGTATLLAKNVTFNNPAGVKIVKLLSADGEVKFQNGIVEANSATEPLTFTSNATLSVSNPPSNTSHVNGFVKKEGIGAFEYPVGDGVRHQKVLVNLTANASGMTVKYFPTDAGNATVVVPLLAYNALEYWEITPKSTATGKVTIFWDDYNNTGITDINHLLVGHKVFGYWVAENYAGMASGSLVSGQVTSQNISMWSPFTLGSSSLSSPLPITLLSFTAAENGAVNTINWKTAAEINARHFVVEKSIDGKNWTIVGEMMPNTSKNYRLDDNTPFSTTYYRLKNVDNDGREDVSNTIVVNRKTGKFAITSIFPNPTTSDVNLKFETAENANITINVQDIFGRIILSQKMEANQGFNLVTVNTAEIPVGAYFLNIKDGSSILTKKIIKN